MRTHCSSLIPAPRSRPMAGRATFTTVPSRNTIEDPATATASTQRPSVLAMSRPCGLPCRPCTGPNCRRTSLTIMPSQSPSTYSALPWPNDQFSGAKSSRWIVTSAGSRPALLEVGDERRGEGLLPRDRPPLAEGDLDQNGVGRALDAEEAGGDVKALGITLGDDLVTIVIADSDHGVAADLDVVDGRRSR